MSRSSRLVRLLPLLPVFLLCASCSDFFVSNSSIATLSVTPTAVILKAAGPGTPPNPAGDTFTLSASATTVGGTPTDETAAAIWKSSNAAVVTANAGVLTTVATTADQTATITATFGGQSGTSNVLTYILTTPTSLNSIAVPTGVNTGSVTPGQTFQLTVSASLSGNATHDLTQFVTWVSSNTSVATVSTTGVVTVLNTATAGGSFTITANANFAGSTVASPPLQFTVITGLL